MRLHLWCIACAGRCLSLSPWGLRQLPPLFRCPMLAFQKRLPYSPPLPIGGTARPVWAAVAVRKRRKTGDENAQAQDEERRQKTLQAHRHRQGETRRRWQEIGRASCRERVGQYV